MKRLKRIICFVVCLMVSPVLTIGAAQSGVNPTFIIIGSGDFTGVYFPAGLAMAQMINGKRTEYGIRATVQSTRGSVFNVNAILAGHLEFGLVQSDKQYQAVKGLGEWAGKGPQKELRAICSLHDESVSLVAAVDAGIQTIEDLKGKKVNLGNPGSGLFRNCIDALEAAGLNQTRDIYPENATFSEASQLLQDNRLDAFFCTVGHPSETLQKATSAARKVRIIALKGPGIDKLIAEKPYYIHTEIPVARFYPGSEGPVSVKTFGVLATLCTAFKVPADVVYAVTKEIFDNLDDLKARHPAFAALKKKEMLKGLSAPLHPGAVRYFMEVGLMK